MKKDYHKGVKLQLYIPEELSQELDKCIQAHNKIHQGNELSKSDLVRFAIKSYLNKHFIDMTSIS